MILKIRYLGFIWKFQYSEITLQRLKNKEKRLFTTLKEEINTLYNYKNLPPNTKNILQPMLLAKYKIGIKFYSSSWKSNDILHSRAFSIN
jgi:hypothetical protein